MYSRETRQKRADGSFVTHLQLAESVWNPHKKRSEVRILHTCGRAEDPNTAERLRNLARSILKRCDPQEIVQHSTQWRLVDAWPYGPLYVLEALWQRLGLAEIIADQLKGRKLDFAVERALFAMVANRACAPCSKLSCYEQWLREDVRIAGTDTLDLHHLYRAMDVLEAHKEDIEQALYFRLADLLTLDVELIFYDTTSLHFEIDEMDQGYGDDDLVEGSMAAGAKTYNTHSAPRKLRSSAFFLMVFWPRKGHNQGRIDGSKEKQGARVPDGSALCRPYPPLSKCTPCRICLLSRPTPTNWASSA